jgi:hypothetical protein
MRGHSARTPTGGVASWSAGWRSAEPPVRGRVPAGLGALATLAVLAGVFGGVVAAQPPARQIDAPRIYALTGVDDAGTSGQQQNGPVGAGGTGGVQPTDPPDPGSSWTISRPLGGVRPGTVDGTLSGTVDGIFTEGSSWT